MGLGSGISFATGQRTFVLTLSRIDRKSSNLLRVPLYNRDCPHASLGPGTPEPSGVTVSRAVDHQLPYDHGIVAKAILAGFHHEYRLEPLAA